MSMIPVVERRPGTLWKVLQFPLTRVVLAIGAVVGVIALLQGAGRVLHVPPERGAGRVLGLVMIVGGCLVYTAYVRLIERRPLVELAPREGPAAFGKGFVAGAALFSA